MAIIRRFTDYWRDTSFAQRLLFISGSGLFVWMLINGVMMFVGDLPLHGPVSYRKAATFAETGWLMCWAVGYVLPYLRLGRFGMGSIVGGTLLFGVGETILMSMQMWRGVPSHYNFVTTFDFTLFSTTGVIAVLWLASQFVLLAALLRPTTLSRSMQVAYITGTLLMIVGGVTGVLMMFNLSGIYQGNLLANARIMFSGEMIGTFTAEGLTKSAGGDIVVVHALGIHGLSAIPLVAWLLSYTTLPERNRTVLTALTAVGYTAATLALAALAAQTIPLTQVGPGTIIAVGASGALVVGLYGFATLRAMPKLLMPA